MLRATSTPSLSRPSSRVHTNTPPGPALPRSHPDPPMLSPPSVIIPEKLDGFINKYAEYTHEKWAFDKVGTPQPPLPAPARHPQNLPGVSASPQTPVVPLGPLHLHDPPPRTPLWPLWSPPIPV